VPGRKRGGDESDPKKRLQAAKGRHKAGQARGAVQRALNRRDSADPPKPSGPAPRRQGSDDG
jgi:hypothetical protein